ncbi:MAG: hypothetical protein K6T91_06490 [Firmicutes bacterium]|nr:hypothetical protein [Bacillota bacterium]
MGFVAFIELIDLLLACLAAFISYGILRKVAGNLALSWTYSFIAFQVLALAMLFMLLYELDVTSLAGISTQFLGITAHFVFVILAFFGLLRQYQLLKGLSRRRGA